LVKVPGFKKVKLNFKKKEAVVTYDPSQTTPEALAATLAKETGFSVAVKPPNEKPGAKKPGEEKPR
jgi:copper chaperone CopZ